MKHCTYCNEKTDDFSSLHCENINFKDLYVCSNFCKNKTNLFLEKSNTYQDYIVLFEFVLGGFIYFFHTLNILHIISCIIFYVIPIIFLDPFVYCSKLYRLFGIKNTRLLFRVIAIVAFIVFFLPEVL